jgi:hypothetical protein
LVCDIKGGTYTEGVWGQCADENILTEEVSNDGRGGENCIIRSFMICTPTKCD